MAIAGQLLATSAITSQLGHANGVYHDIAPSNAVPPFVTLHQQAGTPVYAFAGQPWKDKLWTVKAIDRNSSSRGEDIAAAIIEALHDAPLNVEGHTLMQLRYESDVAYSEVDGGDVWRHRGAVFRIDVDPL